MSLLQKFETFEDALKSILELLEQNKEKLDRLLASGDRNPTLGDGIPVDARYPATDERLPEVKKENPEETEKGAQDLTQVLLFKETDKAFLAVKHGFQVWVAKSHLENSEGYDLGNTYDLKVKEKSKWVLKKLDWKPFEVFKD